MLASAYRTLTNLGAPLIGLYLLKRRTQGREDKARFAERMGNASYPRPAGRLAWCHAASLGEAASILALIEKIRERYPALHILVTTGTVTSARMLEGRLPADTIHQYVPVDREIYVSRFLDHWRPDFALLIESELWPNMLAELRTRKIPAALVNGRMSDRSFRRWYRFKKWSRELLSTFSICLAQTEDDRGRLVALGAKPVRCMGNLKYAANPLPVDQVQLDRLSAEIGDRPVWLLASSHRGEEELACTAHIRLRETYPNLLTIIVPRHAVRGGEVATLVQRRDLKLARRSRQDPVTRDCDVYIADTMGELGLFYRLVQLVALGGSFAGDGGHNPIEPAQLGCAIIFGPHMHNFSAVAHEFIRRRAAIQLKDSNELTDMVGFLLGMKVERILYAGAAQLLAGEKRHVLEEVLEALTPMIGLTGEKAA